MTNQTTFYGVNMLDPVQVGQDIHFQGDLEVLPIEEGEPTDWITTERQYENTEGELETVMHIYPNKGAHLSGMMTNHEGLAESECSCVKKYEMESGCLMVLHSTEPETLNYG